MSPGCLEPYRAHVDPAVVPDAWRRDDGSIEGGAWGPKLTETAYTFDPDDGGPPFPATLLIYSLREMNRRGVSELLRFTRDTVEDVANAQGIQLDPVENANGDREIGNGAKTMWFTRAGTVEASDLFTAGESVRIVGEAWYDARSRTSIVAVGFAQVSGPGTIPFQTLRDETTWVRIVGDPAGSIHASTTPQGFIYNTVSHG